MRQLRDYQAEAIAHLKELWGAGFTRVPMVLATGLGKTEIFTDPTLLDDFLDGGKRVLIIAHTDELIEQAAKKARRNNPGRRVGIVKAGLNQVTAEIVVSSRQTLGHATGGSRRLNALRNVGCIIIDEAHHAIRTNTYGRILEHFGAFCELNGDRKDWPTDCHPHHPAVAGFTATLARGDKEKLSTVWQKSDNLFSRDILFGIRRGYLLDVVGQRVIVPDFNMGNVKVSRGDYQDSAIADELERTFAPEIIAAKYAEVCATPDGFRKGIAFWPLVDTAHHGARAFNDAGIRSEVIHGELPKLERRALLQRLHTGETRVVHGVGVLTEGFDEPTVDVCLVARPTKSAPLYQQMVGRVLRPNLELAPELRGKALVLDVVGAGAEHDLRSLIDLSPERPLCREDEGSSLLELDEALIEWQEEERERAAASGAAFEGAEDYLGPAEVRTFDPLGRDRVWGRTPAGTNFMSAGGVAYVFLVPSLAGEPAHYDVVLCSKRRYVHDGVQPWARGTEYVDLPLDIALAEAEELAIEVGGEGSRTLSGRKSKWRRESPTPAQEGLAKRKGVWVEGMTKGECSEAIDGANAAERIDPLVRAVTEGAK